MRVVQEVCGFMRSRVEGALARGRSRSGPMGSVGVDVVGGNFFYTAQPIGVRNGFDFGNTGEVRSFDVAKVSQHLEAGEIVLMTALGYSASGTIFNVKTEQVAQAAAAALGAAKLVYITPQRVIQHEPSGDEPFPVLQSMRLAEAKALVDHFSTAGGLPAAKVDGATRDPEKEVDTCADAGVSCCGSYMLDLCRHCVRALELGVPRAHLLPPTPGALIQELYTTDGIGTLVSRDVYDGIRLATASDVPSILELIEPLERQGVLIKRTPEMVAREVHMGYYYVYTRDSSLLAVSQLKRYSATHAELGCLVVAREYRRQGCGDAMLGFMERTAIAAGVENLFALSTVTMQWFIERGFSQVGLTDLPTNRVAIYNPERNSKIYMKGLSSSRVVDAEELFWTTENNGAT
jgi:amino-acid N-acetyltransferase